MRAGGRETSTSGQGMPLGSQIIPVLRFPGPAGLCNLTFPLFDRATGSGPHSPPSPAIPGSHLSFFLAPSHICSSSDCETLAHLSAPISHLSATYLHSTGTQAILLWPHPWHPKACLLWACIHMLSVSSGASFHRLSDD